MNFSAKIPYESADAAPQAPRTVAETGLSPAFLLDLLLKTLAMHGMERPSEISAVMKLSVTAVGELIETAKEQKLLVLMGQPEANMVAEMRYQLSDAGKVWADQARNRSSWIGPVPVKFEDYCHQISLQSIRKETLTESSLRRCMIELTLADEVVDRIGPAVNSGASILLHGPPGNGKTSIAEAVCKAFASIIYVPHALAVGDDVVVFFDPVVHKPVDVNTQPQDGALRRPPAFDGRYVPCIRPHVISGGEFIVDKLDIARNPVTGLYDAPMQMKASGGIFVLDDFGRQRNPPQEFINRLIIPLESGTDHLVLESGRKLEVPFDTLVIFATNYEPRSLMDEAGLRRLRHKILVDRPDRKRFVKILLRAARKAGIACGEDIVAYILVDLYGRTPAARLNAFHPRFLIDQAMSICAYRGIQPQLNQSILDRAWENLLEAH